MRGKKEKQSLCRKAASLFFLFFCVDYLYIRLETIASTRAAASSVRWAAASTLEAAASA
jgi:hypothetical protein